MLPKIAILQIGDVHLPHACRASPAIDEKDGRFPPELSRLLGGNPVKTVFKEIFEIIERGQVSCVLSMGDLTDIGNLDGYRGCARYLANALQIGTSGKFRDLVVGILPGNHDIDRALAKNPSLRAKFDPLNSALDQVGLPRIPLIAPAWLDLKAGVSRLAIGLLNSCWGCGSPEYIPAEFREAISKAIEEAVTGGSAEKAVRAYYERQFDTPAFSSETLQAVAKSNALIDPQSLLILCAHHNLLPQRVPRLAPYTELVNSGALRSAVNDLARPVIYLHGHIHDDPIDVLTGESGDVLVSISAPEISAGFNIVEFVFARHGMPLRCNVIKWRFNTAGTVSAQRPIGISLIGRRERSTSSALSSIYAVLLRNGRMYWTDAVRAATEIFTENASEQLLEALELLHADRSISIENYGLPPQNWIIGATI